MFPTLSDEQHLRLHFVSQLIEQGESADEAMEQAEALTKFVIDGPEEDDEDEVMVMVIGVNPLG